MHIWGRGGYGFSEKDGYSRGGSHLAQPLRRAGRCRGSALFRAESAIAVYSISQEKKVRTCGEWADLSMLGTDEFYSFYLELTYTGQSTLPVERFSVIVDDGQAWSWQASDLAPGAVLSAHIYHDKMQSCMNAGLHTATWLIDDTWCTPPLFC